MVLIISDTQPNVGITVPGILAKGTYNGTAVNLAPYFTGALESTNRGGSSGVSVNFLDDGGATPLLMNKPANGTTSNQYFLVSHLYEYFGTLLGCTMQGGSAFPAYAGSGSMYNVHKFMDLSPAEVGYFITQVGLAAASFGVATADVTAVGMALTELFDYRCAPPTVVVPAQGAQLQSICIQESCPLAPNSTCSSYANNITMPSAVSSSASGASATGSATGTATASGTGVATVTPGAGSIAGVGAGAVLAAVAAALL